MNQELGNKLFPTSINKKIDILKKSSDETFNIFCSMKNVSNYPIILSEYTSNTKIINSTNGIIFTEI